MSTWTFIRFLHLSGVIFFVGGQLMLAAVVAPAMRAVEPDDEARSVPMREVARRFGMGSGVALLLIIATGVALAGHYDLWGDSVLQAKLGVLVLVFVLTGLHVVLPFRRALSIGVLIASFVVVYLGLKLTWG